MSSTVERKLLGTVWSKHLSFKIISHPGQDDTRGNGPERLFTRFPHGLMVPDVGRRGSSEQEKGSKEEAQGQKAGQVGGPVVRRGMGNDFI
jgi:hypothetical protein